MLKRGAEILEVKENELTEFHELKDSFNPNNKLSGIICRRSDYRYGALIIFKVNDEECEQVIYGTPKLHYPFNKNGEYIWPKNISYIEVFEKLDGTNILAFSYNYNGLTFITYKTRLTPILKDMRFGSFYSMWKQLLKENPWITDIIKDNLEFNLSFELYGSRNHITVKYNDPLMVTFLFGIHRITHEIMSPSPIRRRYDNDDKTRSLPHFPNNPLGVNKYIDGTDDFTKIYQKLEAESTKKNETDLLEEGYVFYAYIKDEGYRMFKCKADQIKEIHFAVGGIAKNSLWTTAINCYENNDVPTIENFIELLKEEYDEETIGKSEIRIHHIFSDVKKHVEFTAKVNEAWIKAREEGLDVTENKGNTMRFLSKFFSKQDMRKVGTIILKQAGLIN